MRSHRVGEHSHGGEHVDAEDPIVFDLPSNEDHARQHHVRRATAFRENAPVHPPRFPENSPYPVSAHSAADRLSDGKPHLHSRPAFGRDLRHESIQDAERSARERTSGGIVPIEQVPNQHPPMQAVGFREAASLSRFSADTVVTD
jgi:hypothetical protein